MAVLLAGCSGSQPQGRELSAPPDSLRLSVREVPNDSLSYYLGLSEGEARAEFLVATPDWLTQYINDRDYIEGFSQSISADTVSFSYSEGVKAARELAYYINSLENQGVKINRQLLARHLKQFIISRTLPDEDAREKADSISNKIIAQCLKSYVSQQ